MRVLLDTNIVMDALARREPFNKEAEQIFLYCENESTSGYLSSNSVADIYYLLRKHYPREAVHEHLLRENVSSGQLWISRLAVLLP